MNIEELKNRAKAPVTQPGGGRMLAEFFEHHRGSIQAALPRHISADRMLRVALQAVRTTPSLRDCSIESLFGAVVQCSSLGLEPNDTRGLAYLVPFWNTRKRVKEAQMIVGYRGFIDLARRGGEVAHIVGRVVREQDGLEITQGTEEKLVHYPYIAGDRGNIIGAYAVAKMRDGAPPLFYFMPMDDILKARGKSSGAGYWDKKSGERRQKLDSPWYTDEEAMCVKTAVRRIAKWLPMSIDLSNAIRIDEMAESGEEQALDGIILGETEETEPETKPTQEEES